MLRTGASRHRPPDPSLTARPFRTPQPKGKGVYVGLMVLVVVAGFFLQLNWMHRIRERDLSEMAPNSMASKLGRWMLRQKGVESDASLRAPGVETIECENCQGTGGILSKEGSREICPICQGVGSRLIRYLDSSDYICPNCVGMGRAEDPDTHVVGPCPRCGGRGLIRNPAETDDPVSGD